MFNFALRSTIDAVKTSNEKKSSIQQLSSGGTEAATTTKPNWRITNIRK